MSSHRMIRPPMLSQPLSALLLTLLLSFSASAVFGASFDCARAGNAMERAICATPAINRLDGEMGTLYAQLLDGLSADQKAHLREGQRNWIAMRNARCDEAATGSTSAFVDCVRPMYDRRMNHLRAELGQPHQAHYPDGPQQRVCGHCQASGPDAAMGCAGYTNRSGCVSTEQCAWVVSRCPN